MELVDLGDEIAPPAAGGAPKLPLGSPAEHAASAVRPKAIGGASGGGFGGTPGGTPGGNGSSPDETEGKSLLWREERRARRQARKQERMNEQQMRYGLLLTIASVFDVFISGFMVCVAFAHGYLDNGVSLYCIGIQAFSHALSSLLLALRFGDEYRQPEDAPAGPQGGLLRARRRTYLVREKLVSFAMGFVLLIGSVAMLTKAVRKLLYWDKWFMDHHNVDRDAEFATTFLAWYGVVVYAAQAVLRSVTATVLKRKAVADAFSASLVSLAFVFVIGVAAVVEHEYTWKAEPVAAIVLAWAAIAEGGRLIYKHRGDIDIRLDLDSWA
eukprot:TRINITY_DN25952_c0_g1_i1.p1 TRINITY_DN25952_c0_g1~~TRINITY_DN25952_c0_g1_i1.p1  ORF type:complete len:326 (-),score=84.83 TRINITY_DN25952_c0_g1_i1:323-1300(-)